MEIEKSSMWEDVKKILDTYNKKIRHNYRIKLHTEKDDFWANNLLEMDLVRDYVNNYGDEITIKVVLPLGTYSYKLYPFRENLEVTIEMETISDFGGKDNKKIPVEIERFKAILIGDIPQPVKSGVADTNEETANRTMVEVEFQLLERSLEPLRIKVTQGIVRDVSYFDLIHGCLGGESFKTLVEGKPSIDGIDIVEFDNKEKHKHVIIPSNTRLVSLATYVQTRMGGLYYNGVGQYLQKFRKKKFWFVYPITDTERFEKHNVPKMHLYIVSKDRYPELDNTFRIENPDLLEVVCNSTQQYLDDAKNKVYDKGIGIRSAHSRDFMPSNADKKVIKMTPKGPVADRKSINYEFKVEERKDKLDYSPTGGESITSNPFIEFSELNATTGRIMATWQHSEEKHIYPNMPVRVFLLEDDTVKVLDGVINRTHTYSALDGIPATSRSHKQSTVMEIFTGYYKPDKNKSKDGKSSSKDKKFSEIATPVVVDYKKSPYG